jgi:hypothetical protein
VHYVLGPDPQVLAFLGADNDLSESGLPSEDPAAASFWLANSTRGKACAGSAVRTDDAESDFVR